MELKKNNIYIFRMRFYPNSIRKFRVNDLTETTIKCTNMDTGTSRKRELLSDFKDEWEIIETVFDWEGSWYKQLENWKNQPQRFEFIPKEDDLVPYSQICGCNPANGGSGICGCIMGNKLVPRDMNSKGYNSYNTTFTHCHCTGACKRTGKCPNSLN